MNKDTVSLPISKKLKEAGWDQLKNGWYHLLDSKKRLVATAQSYEAKKHNAQRIAAPTIGELLEALPSSAAFDGYYQGESLKVRKEAGLDLKAIGWLSLDRQDGGGWNCGYGDNGTWIFGEYEAADPADALALLWLALKEKGIVPALLDQSRKEK